MSATEEDAASVDDAHEEFKPTGTIFLLVCYVATLVLLWVTVYLIMLSRGTTG